MNTGTPMRDRLSAIVCSVIGLAGAGGAGDQAVPVGQRRQQEALDVAVLGNEDRIGHTSLSCGPRSRPLE